MGLLETEQSLDESQPMLDGDTPNRKALERRSWPKAYSLAVIVNCFMFTAVVVDAGYRLIARLDRGNKSHSGYQTDLNPLMKQTSHFCEPPRLRTMEVDTPSNTPT